MIAINETIQQVEHLYRSLTGKDVPTTDAQYATIPPEKDPVKYVQEQVDRLVGILGTGALEQAPQQVELTPPISVWESAQEIVICVEIPGVPREAVEVAVMQNLLVISGQQPMPFSNGNGNGRVWQMRLAERPLGTFRRTIALPPQVEVEQLAAEFKDGVLMIRLPQRKNIHAQVPKTVPVK